MRNATLRNALMISGALLAAGCSMAPSAKVDPTVASELPPYSGPKARVGIAKFDWKVGMAGGSIEWQSPEGKGSIRYQSAEQGYLSGLADMLATAVQGSNRFRLLERGANLASLKEEIAMGEDGWVEDESAVEKGSFKGADILIVGAVTGWEDGTSGTKGGGGILGGGGLLGGMLGSSKSSLAMDIRLIDARTSEVITATSVRGEAREFNMGAIVGGVTGSALLGGGLAGYQKTPMEAAIRKCITEATKWICQNTPQEYFKH